MNYIRVLGCHGGKGDGISTTSILIDEHVVIDAGNIIHGLRSDASNIDYIFLTHSHLDHIMDIPFLIDAYFEKRKKPLYIYGSKETLEHIKKYIFNWEMWPDFSEIKLIQSKENSVKFIEISENETICLNSMCIKPIAVNHTVQCFGYVVKKRDFSLLFSADTYICDNIWNELNSNFDIKCLIIDVSFPSNLDELAKVSKHLTPQLLKEELKKLKRDDIKIYVNHLKPVFVEKIKSELVEIGLGDIVTVLKDGDIIEF